MRGVREKKDLGGKGGREMRRMEITRHLTSAWVGMPRIGVATDSCEVHMADWFAAAALGSCERVVFTVRVSCMVTTGNLESFGKGNWG